VRPGLSVGARQSFMPFAIRISRHPKTLCLSLSRAHQPVTRAGPAPCHGARALINSYSKALPD
jgi:hypothetical protein